MIFRYSPFQNACHIKSSLSKKPGLFGCCTIKACQGKPVWKSSCKFFASSVPCSRSITTLQRWKYSVLMSAMNSAKTATSTILVTFSKPPSLFKFVRIENHPSDLPGEKVDLVMKDSLKPANGKNILRETIPLDCTGSMRLHRCGIQAFRSRILQSLHCKQPASHDAQG